MLPTVQVPSHRDAMTDRGWSSASLARSWGSIGPDSLNSSLSLSHKWTSRLKNDKRLSNSLDNSDWTDFKRDKNASALAEAVCKGRGRHVQLLLEAGTDPNVPDERGTPALTYAVLLTPESGVQDKIIRLLLKYGADANIGDRSGCTPLMHAAKIDSHDAALTILHHGNCVDPGIQDDDGNSALMYAAAFGRTEIALLILSTFKNLHHLTYINQRNRGGYTATDLAEQNGHDSLALLLKVENEFAPRPSGPSSYIPRTGDLDRPPTPTETLDLKEPPPQLKKAQSSRNFKVARPSLEEQKILDHLSKSLDLSSSPGSGNEADTESLMEGEKLTVEDIEETEPTMAAPSTDYNPFNVISSDVIQNELYTDKHISNPMDPLSQGDVPTYHLISGGNLRKTSLTSSSSTFASEGMPKIKASKSSHIINKNIKSLVQEDIDLRPGQRPPTPSRPSLPTLLPNRLQDIPLNASISSTKSEGGRNISHMRRLTLSSMPRSSSDSNHLTSSPQTQSSEEEYLDILDSSTRSEGWDQLRGRASRCTTQLGTTEGHVVHLPPIGQSRFHDMSLRSRLPDGSVYREESVLNVAKKTLEKLESVLGPDGQRSPKVPRSRTHHQLHLTS